MSAILCEMFNQFIKISFIFPPSLPSFPSVSMNDDLIAEPLKAG